MKTTAWITTILMAFSIVVDGQTQNLASINLAVFEENKGQMIDQYWQPRPDVLYYGEAGGMNYYIRNNGMSYQLSRVECWKDADDHNQLQGETKKQVPDEIGTYRVDAEWLGHNTDYTVTQGTAIEGYNNYYNVPEGVEPALFVKQYEAITLQNLWNGIDVHYYSTNGQLESDYLVAPGADYRQIRMEIKGADLSIGTDGHLVMKTPYGEIHEGTLKVYQGDQLVAANWVIIGNIVSFDIPNFDPCLALRIDPLVRVWGTYFGHFTTYGLDVVTDRAGNVYLAGKTTSANAISSGGHQNTKGGGNDAFLTKLSTDGSQIWGTYYGGSLDDEGNSLAIDYNANLYVVGLTWSTTGIAAGGHQNQLLGGLDAFLVKFDSNGVRQWGTYYGGSARDIGNAVALDNNNNIIIAGDAYGADNAFVLNAHQSTYGGNIDAFVAKFNNSGTRLWGTYYGGSNQDQGLSLTTDSTGNIFLGGLSSSSDVGLIASGGHQNVFGGVNDAYLVKFDANGTRQWGSYYGGSQSEKGWSVTTDNNGDVYLSGNTYSSNGIAYLGHQNMLVVSPQSASDAFLVKFNSNGVRLWGTYYGGEGIESAYKCRTDNAGNVYIAGATLSFSGIASIGHQNNIGGNDWDAYLAKFTSNGIRLSSTYYGGPGDDWGYALNIDLSGNVYLSGSAGSYTGIATPNAHQTNWVPGVNAANGFLVKFKQPHIAGLVWQDYNTNCIKDSIEQSFVNGISLIIQPGNYIVQTVNGTWYIDSLPAGTYTATIDTTNTNWIVTCPTTQSFTVVDPNSFTVAPPFGMKSKYPCQKPTVSIAIPSIRRGNWDYVQVNVCNQSIATDVITAGYVDVELDTNFTVLSGSLPYTSLANNKFRVSVGNLQPGQCIGFRLLVAVGTAAMANQTLCMSAELFPQPTCIFDSIPALPLPGSTLGACQLPYDNSLLQVTATCFNDSVKLAVYNNGVGSMTCFAPVLIYLDGGIYHVDSAKLLAGDSIIFKYPGSNQTWHIQTAQHPLNYTAVRYPMASIELCGNGTWIPGIVSTLPLLGQSPVLDLFCGQVTGPYDPNDKTGYPLGVGSSHAILPNQDIDYLVRFQNVGNDTAFNVVILDTLSTDLDIFSLRSGASSHPYEFRMYGPRIIEWRFTNIMLPDSTTNEPASQGFVKFKVKQAPDLPAGTTIENNAAIYFDFEAPVFTNTYVHTVVNNYSTTTICNPTTSTTTETACGSYTWNGQTYALSDTYTYQTTNAAGCDSTATLELTIENEFANDTITGAILADTTRSYTYTLPFDAAVTNYEWELTCGQFIGGNGPRSVTVIWDGTDSCKIWAIRSNAACADTLELTVYIDFGSSIKETFLSQLSLYPNPSNGLTTITWGQTLQQQPTLVLFDALSRVIAVPVDCLNSGCTIDTRNLPAGVYTIMLNHPSGNAIRKLIKTE